MGFTDIGHVGMIDPLCGFTNTTALIQGALLRKSSPNPSKTHDDSSALGSSSSKAGSK